MNNSIKLRTAMEDIKEIIKKYDIGACIYLHDFQNGSGQMDYFHHFTPGYSALEHDPASGIVKLKINREHHGGSATLRDERVTASINMLDLFTRAIGSQVLAWQPLLEELETRLGTTHTPMEHTPGPPPTE